ncbi:hypothetical protein FHU23_002194 [Clostridium saccharobutylicum]|uniref:Uncharacterized protein n=1 Tax=Clostridium saccharobutylicum DSM 13864 TaxID=1345695 RepID=U5MLJ6_CLOSA|nr:hypothetical protein CLSA_c04240 [Clostridium saccharobutylicum DSM 13864]MBA2905642.1 hypothetical protein [Clostridium saccharobutylicum]MBA8982429.1 hypothetical protein [Clostridium saccharobutylicum]MBA9000688.1 hypothetical protein [Clostridium saccharobutylicum]MBA9012161.1 hypothetical protein [Clostridium saccharobutylicum]
MLVIPAEDKLPNTNSKDSSGRIKAIKNPVSKKIIINKNI